MDYSNLQSACVGSYVHYSETHDNNRLAAQRASGILPEEKSSIEKKVPNRAWSLLRNRLCALTSPSGAFGFTCGVEWLATEKINVHQCTGLNWGNPENIVPELAQLNELISNHPCFFDGAKLTRLSAPDSPIYALFRESAEGKDSVLILVNTDVEKENSLVLPQSAIGNRQSAIELLGQPPPEISAGKEKIIFTLPPGAAFCLASTQKPVGLSGENYRRARAQAAFAIQALNHILPTEEFSNFDWQFLAAQIENSPQGFLAAAGHLREGRRESWDADTASLPKEFSALIEKSARREIFPNVITWTLIDARRVTPVPANHWLLIEDSAPFRAELRVENAGAIHVQSIAAGNNFIAVFAPQSAAAAELTVERHAATSQKISTAIRFLAPEPQLPAAISQLPSPDAIVLLTNGRGGMARLCVDLGRVNSKYDCVLGANLNPNFPVDRHVFVKRIRVWVNADGFLSSLDFKNLHDFKNDPCPIWKFVANAGDGCTVEIELRAEMLEGKNTVVFQFNRPTEKSACGKQLPAGADVRLTVRFDIEDRNFHCETKRNGGADFHFSTNCREIKNSKFKIQNCAGFEFTPAADRQLRIFSDAGEYHPQPEWCENIPHPVEATRGQIASGDAYSPGWFEIPLPKGVHATLVATAEISSSEHEFAHFEKSEADQSRLASAATFEGKLLR
ncbi:MAG: glycogen debranching enzyme N-terminal domain-containing protein, partial [Limisphaerales bacterium]